MTDSADKSPRRRYVLAAAIVVILAGVAVLGVAIADRHHRSPGIARQQGSTAPSTRIAQPGTSPTKVPRRGTASPAPPRAGAIHGVFSVVGGRGARLDIPALGVSAPIVPTGAVKGSMVIPADVHQVGWYDGVDKPGGSGVAPAPGQSGVAILAGHVNWVGQGPGVLRDIGTLESGDRINVVGTNGRTTHWAVAGKPVMSPKSQLPAALFSNSGPARLALVTCGGPYDSATGNYADNVIVWAGLID